MTTFGCRYISYLTLITTGLCVTSISASELIIRDARVQLGIAPGDFSYEFQDAVDRESGDGSFGDAYQLTLSYLHGFTDAGDTHGLYSGAEIAYTTATVGANGSLTAPSLRGIAGYGWQYTDRWSFFGEFYLGYGSAEIVFPDTTGFSGFNSDGSLLEYGLRGHTYYRLGDRHAVGLGFSYSTASYETSGNGIDFTIDNSGISLFLTYSYRWSSFPPGLE